MNQLAEYSAANNSHTIVIFQFIFLGQKICIKQQGPAQSHYGVVKGLFSIRNTVKEKVGVSWVGLPEGKRKNILEAVLTADKHSLRYKAEAS